MISKNDRRRSRRNSLALYNRKIAKARSTLKRIERNISTIGEVSDGEMDVREDKTQITPEQPNPFVKCLKPINDNDTDSNSDNDITDSEDDEDFHMGSTYAPPSTSHFLEDVVSSKSQVLDKETESALKHLRQHPEKVPQVKAYNLPIAFFLCRIIYHFAIRQGLHQVKFLNRWLFYAFPEVNQEKVHFYLGRIRAKYPNASLFQTLRELARSLSPDDFMTLQTIQPRDKSEGLTDLLIRLQSDIPIIMDCTALELPTLIMQFIKNSERNSQAGTEFRREAIRLRGKPTLDKLHKIVSRVDRLIQPSSECQISGFHDRTKIANKNICQVCAEEHTNLRDDGTAWPSCETCMYTAQASFYNERKFGTYNQPRRAATPMRQNQASSPKCRDCENNTNWNRIARQYFDRCYPCFRKSKSDRRSQPNDQEPRRSRSNNFGRDVRPTTYANAARRNSYSRKRNINEFRTNRNYDPTCYRVAVRVRNLSKRAEITGLFDTGCNVDVVSRKACTELGIAHLIEPCNSTATVVDGAPVNITGRVRATVHIGNVQYTSEFSVIEHMSQYDMMVGTKFMQTSGLMKDILTATQDKLGAENVTRGN